ncbi:hypothetical protein I6A60_06995 [Frankia sp. AgB1.9]|uniref:hypothetical protein n=1 Tax=unclassified Frankia TaxID=2632575 RepID=UPI0019343D3B|nr:MULTISPECIES: hypothetical protein [unclassified Frankia]MBL7488884.1 hypothetical protein [Frankia sp. AgW1.1]MBL7547620.1 hypothetical protein [Frankia sp. AgB1.9]MBL7621499.1 hypothetical protein [Frankia sp. AgB1.8]
MASLPAVFFAIVVVGIVALSRGEVRWARIHSRRVAALVVFLGLIAFAAVGSELPNNTTTGGKESDVSTVGVASLSTPGDLGGLSPASTPAPDQTPPPPASARCRPVTNRGKCYQAGEVCRRGDRGSQGVGVNGEAIVCRDDNGWRWEPA